MTGNVNAKARERHLFILRSGERDKDRALTPLGRSHLMELGGLIRRSGEPEFAVVSSLSKDAIASAGIIANVLGTGVATSAALTSGGLKKGHADFMGGEVIYGIRIRIGHSNLYADPSIVQAALNGIRAVASVVLVFDAYPNMNNFMDFVGMQNRFNESIGPMDNGYAMHIDLANRLHELIRYD